MELIDTAFIIMLLQVKVGSITHALRLTVMEVFYSLPAAAVMGITTPMAIFVGTSLFEMLTLLRAVGVEHAIGFPPPVVGEPTLPFPISQMTY